MTNEQRLKNLSVPAGTVDAILDTDAYNEIDDQFALAYMLRSKDKINVRAIYAAPFFNSLSTSAKDGMEKSYDEIMKLLGLLGEEVEVYKGSETYLPNEKNPVLSDAVQDLVTRARGYSPERPLYVVAIGAITNIASALLVAPDIADNIVVVWLGGHARHFSHTNEFNMMQDFAAARVVMSSGAPFVQLPCVGVVSEFYVTRYELEHWLKGKAPLADYLAQNAVTAAESYASGKPWSRVIWDVCAVAWLLNDGNRFMESRTVPTLLPSDEGQYMAEEGYLMEYVYHVKRDALMTDLFEKILK